MKNRVILMLVLTSVSTLAEASGKDIYINAVIGAAVVIGILFSWGVYRLGKYAVSKLNPNAPQWLQKVAGVIFAIGGWSIWISLAG